MIIELKHVKYIKGNCKGLTIFKTNQRVVIEISQKLNTNLSEWATTVLHELYHVFVALIKVNGALIDRRLEHKYIYKAVDKSIRLLNLMVRR